MVYGFIGNPAFYRFLGYNNQSLGSGGRSGCHSSQVSNITACKRVDVRPEGICWVFFNKGEG